MFHRLPSYEELFAAAWVHQCTAAAEVFAAAHTAPLAAAPVVVSGSLLARPMRALAGSHWATCCRLWVCMLAAVGCGTPGN